MAAIRDACSLQLFSRAALYSVCRQYCLVSNPLPGCREHGQLILAVSNTVSCPCEGTICLMSQQHCLQIQSVCVHGSTEEALSGAAKGSSQAVSAECLADASDNW